MIRITRNRKSTAIHPDFTGDKLVAKLLLLAQARQASDDSLAFEGAIGDWKKAKDFLKVESAEKCAYCEAATAIVAFGDVEHFRPKSVYWWLALCVDNYVFSCQICNQNFKGDKFPINGVLLRPPKVPTVLPSTAAAKARLAAKIAPDPGAVTDSAVAKLWKAEDADLPHPYLEDPEKLFSWTVSEVNEEVLLVAPDDASPRAARAVKAATDFLGLNRETLRKQRYFLFVHLKFTLLAWTTATGALRQAAEAEILRMCEARQSFAGMCRYFARRAGVSIPAR